MSFNNSNFPLWFLTGYIYNSRTFEMVASLWYKCKHIFFSYRTIKVEIYDWDRDGRWQMHTYMHGCEEKDTNFLIFVLSFICFSLFTNILEPAPHLVFYIFTFCLFSPATTLSANSPPATKSCVAVRASQTSSRWEEKMIDSVIIHSAFSPTAFI